MQTGRKHRTQMKTAEIAALEARIRLVCDPEIASHAAERMQEKRVSGQEIANCIKWGQAIEIHNEAGELRAVVRHAYGKPKVAVCVVISLETGVVVTTWKNAGNDNHKTLNVFAYQWTVNVASLLAPAAVLYSPASSR